APSTEAADHACHNSHGERCTAAADRRRVMPIPNPNGGALTEEHVQIRESVRDFADREVVPVANELDNKAAEIPPPIVKKMAEPDAGSDSAGIKCRAVRQGDKYVVTGEKTWCTWANKAHLLCTTVVTDPQAAKKHNRISILLIPKTPGDEFHPPQLAGSPIPTIGYKGMNSYALQFDGYEVPAENLLGAQTGKGFYQLM